MTIQRNHYGPWRNGPPPWAQNCLWTCVSFTNSFRSRSMAVAKMLLALPISGATAQPRSSSGLSRRCMPYMLQEKPAHLVKYWLSLKTNWYRTDVWCRIDTEVCEHRQYSDERHHVKLVMLYQWSHNDHKRTVFQPEVLSKIAPAEGGWTKKSLKIHCFYEYPTDNELNAQPGAGYLDGSTFSLTCIGLYTDNPTESF